MTGPRAQPHDQGMFTFAIGIALVAALCLALGTHLQHRVVAGRSADAAAPASPTTPRAHVVRRIFRSPLWLVGLALLMLETVLNVIALGLAPVALIQPLGTLSLVAAVILSLRAARSKGTDHAKTQMTKGVMAGIVITIVSVGLFVGVSAKWSIGPEASPGRLLTLGCLLMVFSAVGAAVVNSSTGHLARIACAGVLFGTVAASTHVLLFTLLQAFDGAVLGPDLLPVIFGALSAVHWFLITGLILGSITGMWVVQTAYLSGPPETVLAGLTVIDPLTAVGIGALLLGEYAPMPTPVLMTLAVVAVFAVLGVLLLVRAHPSVLRPARAPHEASVGRPARAPSTLASYRSTPARHGAAVTNERSWS